MVYAEKTAAPTHEMWCRGSRALNDSYAALLEHYGLSATPSNSGGLENVVATRGHYRLKDSLDQDLMLRASRVFDSIHAYGDFFQAGVAKRNRLVQTKLGQEKVHLQPLCRICRNLILQVRRNPDLNVGLTSRFTSHSRRCRSFIVSTS